MIITESTIQLSSTHTSVEYSERRESLVAWQHGKVSDGNDREKSHHQKLKAKAMALAEQATRVSLSTEAREKVSQRTRVEESVSEEDRMVTDLNMRILKALFEKMTGRKMKLHDPGAGGRQATSAEVPMESKQAPIAQAAEGWGVQYEHHEIHHESEASQFSAEGLVQTADGRQIAITVELNLSRSFTSTLDESFRAGEALKDPLVVNFDGPAAQLTRDTFRFDIDADGSEDQISFVAPGSGFLALDADNDGRINSGSELFGALSGDGFADLAAYDQDANGWIDENDEVYSRLRIWAKTSSGEDQLLALGEKGIGALYLGRVESPFAIKGSDNELLGQVRSTGIFLREDGGAGTVQQLDLVA